MCSLSVAVIVISCECTMQEVSRGINLHNASPKPLDTLTTTRLAWGTYFFMSGQKSVCVSYSFSFPIASLTYKGYTMFLQMQLSQPSHSSTITIQHWQRCLCISLSESLKISPDSSPTMLLTCHKESPITCKPQRKKLDRPYEETRTTFKETFEQMRLEQAIKWPNSLTGSWWWFFYIKSYFFIL
jgi:hypothetical protein